MSTEAPPQAAQGRARTLPPGYANEKEYLNEMLTRKAFYREMRQYDANRVGPLRQWVAYKSQPLWRRAWQQVAGWWEREVAWPLEEPAWWPERLSWTAAEEDE